MPLDASTLARLPDLKLIAVAATGTDCIDKAYCHAHRVAVSNIRTYATHTVPEHTFALMLALRRSIVPYRADVLAGEWQKAGQFCFFHHPIHDLAGARLGIVGERVAEAFWSRACRPPEPDVVARHEPKEPKLNQKLNRRSHVITEGDAGAPRRAQLRAVNFKDGDWDKPIVGVLNLHSTMNPCNAGIQPLIDRAVAELAAVGAKPQTIGGPTGSDAIGMGTEGMRFSLPSREVISHSYQIGTGSHQMDGGFCIAGCDKNKPGAVMGMLFANVPTIYVDAGTIKPGKWKGEDKDIASAFQSVGEVSAGRMSREDFEGIECNACMGVGVCGGQYTANTMACAIAALGLSLIDSPLMAAEDEEKLDSVAKSAHVLKNAIEMDLKPRDIVTRKSIWNAVATVMANSRLDQRSTSHSCHCESCSRQMDIGRLRGRPAEGPRSVRPEAVGPLPGGRLSSCRRRATGAENVARPWRSARRVHDHHWPHDGGGVIGSTNGTPRRPRRNPSMVESNVHDGASQGSQG